TAAERTVPSRASSGRCGMRRTEWAMGRDATVRRVLLTPKERDRLLLFQAAELARARRARGLRLNVPEATAIVADAVCEAARDGLGYEEAIERGRGVLGPDDVLPGVSDVLRQVAVEPLFGDGSRFVIVPDP